MAATRVRSEKGIKATGWLSTAGVQLALLCFLFLIVGEAALAGAEDSASLSGPFWARDVRRVDDYRARHQGALQSVLEAAERFRQLGDREMVTQCLAVADRLAVGGQEAPGEQVRLEIFRTRWDTRWLLGPRPAWENPMLWLFPDASVGP